VKHGPITGNDVQVLPKKRDSHGPHGGAVINTQKATSDFTPPCPATCALQTKLQTTNVFPTKLYTVFNFWGNTSPQPEIAFETHFLGIILDPHSHIMLVDIFVFLFQFYSILFNSFAQ